MTSLNKQKIGKIAYNSNIPRPAIIVIGCIFAATSFSASLKSSPAKTTTEVVPSPTSSS